MTNPKPNVEQSQIALFQTPEVPNAFRKAVQVIHSKPKGELSLLHRKLANAWLKNAAETLPDAEGFWTIHTTTMAKDIGFNSNNREYLINSARALMTIAFEWDVISPEGKRKFWKASVLYTDVEVRPDMIRYTISRHLKDQILSPEMYAIIDMNILKKFRRTSSLGLYEFCIRFEKINRTAEVEWQLFRDMIMGQSADSKSYQEYKVFKDKVLKVAIAEINSQSDIKIEMHERKAGRRVEAIAFTVTKHQQHLVDTINDEQHLLDVGELVKMGLLQSEARSLVKQYTHQQIAGALTYTRKRVSDKKVAKIENPAAYLRKALANGWAVVNEKEDKGGKLAQSNNSGPDLNELYMLESIKQAEAYFAELNTGDQNGLVDEYNATDVAASLKIKSSKPGKATRTEFYRWLALKTWGHPKPEDLLEFAQKLMRSSNAYKAA